MATTADIRLDDPEVRRDIRGLEELSSDIRAVLHERSTGIHASLPDIEDTFYEGCYCLCAVQNPAVRTVRAMALMRSWDTYGRLGASAEADEAIRREIAVGIRELVRFHNVKSGRMVAFRRQVGAIHSRLSSGGEAPPLRDWLMAEVVGFGFKEAGHFLRNVGFRGLAIPDIHVLRRLDSLGLAPRAGKSMGAKAYRAAETAMLRYAAAIGTDIDSLDALWWSRGSGAFGR